MEEGKILIQKGLDYCKHVEGYKTARLLSQPILINMAGIAGECLLSGLSRLKNHEAAHGNISSHISTLQYIMPVPVEVAKASSFIEKSSSACSLDNSYPDINMPDLVDNLLIIKNWVVNESAYKDN